MRNVSLGLLIVLLFATYSFADDCAPQAHKGKSFKGLKLCKSCTRDGGMPSKAGLQGQALNNHELRW